MVRCPDLKGVNPVSTDTLGSTICFAGSQDLETELSVGLTGLLPVRAQTDCLSLTGDVEDWRRRN